MKNKAVCAFAKTGKWSLRIFGYFWVVAVVVIALVEIVLLVKAKWDWQQYWILLKGLGVVMISFVIGLGIIWLLITWYEWAKRYSEDC